jgi:hypothetical protein
MHEAGRAMFRMRMQREHPEWGAADIDEAEARWLGDAPLGPGRPASDERWIRLTVSGLPADRDPAPSP